MALYNLSTQHKPETTLAGLIIALISISLMWLLIHYKTQAGVALGSEAILADAKCARVCMYMSGLLLLSSLIYSLSGIWFVDSLGPWAWPTCPLPRAARPLPRPMAQNAAATL